jgi:hypothetical protein
MNEHALNSKLRYSARKLMIFSTIIGMQRSCINKVQRKQHKFLTYEGKDMSFQHHEPLIYYTIAKWRKTGRASLHGSGCVAQFDPARPKKTEPAAVFIGAVLEADRKDPSK